jgi:endo-1,4-beta-xylanase
VLAVAAALVVIGLLRGPRQRTPADLRGPGLGAVAAHSGRFVGVAVRAYLLDDHGYATTIARAFSAVTPENEMKWDATEPQRGHFAFGAADRIVAFAAAHGLRVRGHTLVWHNQLPGWLANKKLTGARLVAALRDHIDTVVGHFRGRVAQWDVVNEAIGDDLRLRHDIWLDRLGPGYIALAFRLAHAADPNAELFYNDYGAEGAGAKADAVYRLVKMLKSEGVPIGGVGLQGHVSTAPIPGLKANLERFAALGLDIVLSEVDVRLRGKPVTAAQLRQQADAYARIGQACTAVPRCRGIVVWGLDDDDSWIPQAFPGYGSATLFDGHLHPKPAFFALRRALAG